MYYLRSEAVSDKVMVALTDMFESGSSETAGVADILNTIASNADADDPEMATDEHLVGCAVEIIEAAQSFIDAVAGPKPEDPVSLVEVVKALDDCYQEIIGMQDNIKDVPEVWGDSSRVLLQAERILERLKSAA